MEHTNLTFQTIGNQRHEEVISFLENSSIVISKEKLQQIDVIAALENSTIVGVAIIGKYEMNHSIKICRNLMFHYLNETFRKTCESTFVSLTLNLLKTKHESAIVIAFETSENNGSTSVFENHGMQYLDTNLAYATPLPLTMVSKAKARVVHSDSILKYDMTQHQEYLKGICDLCNHVYQGHITLPIYKPANLEKNLKNGLTIFFSIDTNNKVTGVIEVYTEKNRPAYVNNIAVSYRKLGSGLANNLTQRACEYAYSKGAETVTTNVNSKNSASRSLNERFGFKLQSQSRRFAIELTSENEVFEA